MVMAVIRTISGWGRRAVLILVLLVASATLSRLVSPNVTYDSWQYLSSGMSLAQGTFPDGYFLIREPLYPLLISLVIGVGLSLEVLVGLQVFLFLHALSMLWNMFRLGNERRSRVTVATIWIAITVFLYGGYASFVGQQLIMFWLAVLFLYVDSTMGDRDVKANFAYHLGVGLLASLCSVFFAASLLILWALRLSAILINQKSFRKSLKTLVGQGLNWTIIGVTAALSAWSLFRMSLPEYQDQLASDRLVSQGMFGPHKSVLENSIPLETAMITSFLANLDLVPNQGWGLDTSLGKALPGNPNYFFGSAPLLGGIDDCVPKPSPSVPYVSLETLEYFVDCEEPAGYLAPPLPMVILWVGSHLVGTLLLLLGLVSVFFRLPNNELMKLSWLLAFSLSASYAIFLGGIPRYGMPSQILFMVLGLTLLLRGFPGADLWRSKISPNRLVGDLS